MNVASLVLVLGFSSDYQIIGNRIENESNRRVAELFGWEIYNTDNRHSSIHDDGKRLRLKSKLGYWLENIPLYHNRFYNECVEIFLEIEKELPKAYKCLKNHGQNAREIRTLKFSFPRNPELDLKNETYFWVKNGITCTSDGREKTGDMWALGLYERSSDTIFVTFHPNYYHILPVHEYIHSCGYGHVCGSDKKQEKINFQCAERANK